MGLSTLVPWWHAKTPARLVKTMKKFIGDFLAAVLLMGIFFGLFVLVTVPFEMLKKAKAESWPSRPGIVTLSYASQKSGSVGRSGSAPYFKPEICGTYRDNGERFCVWRIRYGGFRFGGGKRQALETIAKYPVGSNVSVYFSPDDPKETVLEAVSPWREMYTLLGLGTFFLVLPFVLWLFGRKATPS